MDKTGKFVTKMTSNEKAALLSFKDVVENFLENHKNQKQRIAKIIQNYKKQGC